MNISKSVEQRLLSAGLVAHLQEYLQQLVAMFALVRDWVLTLYRCHKLWWPNLNQCIHAQRATLSAGRVQPEDEVWLD